jgi:small acid-soluble spore protein A (major alpha-type SASP)
VNKLRKSSKSKSTKSTTSKSSIENMKYEIASEFGVNLGPDSTSRANGTVGGEITKRLVDKGKNKMGGNSKNSN